MILSKISKVLENIQHQVGYGDKKQLLLVLHDAEALVERDDDSITVKIIKNKTQLA